MNGKIADSAMAPQRQVAYARRFCDDNRDAELDRAAVSDVVSHKIPVYACPLHPLRKTNNNNYSNSLTQSDATGIYELAS
jgi:hypothetical protein